MSTISRYRVKIDAKTWRDPGPDLLRTKRNARQQLSALMGGLHQGWMVRRVLGGGDKTKWTRAISKRDALVEFDGWKRSPEIVFGRKQPGGGIAPVIQVRRETVRMLPTDDSSPGTVLVRSLIQHQFPRINFCGAYNFRKIAGTDEYSDHAWGTAVDECQDPPEPTNDETTDWVARMGRTGNMRYDYALGSHRGQVMEVAPPDFELVPSTASTTHLSHCHVSIVDHHGVKPPRTGGVW